MLLEILDDIFVSMFDARMILLVFLSLPGRFLEKLAQFVLWWVVCWLRRPSKPLPTKILLTTTFSYLMDSSVWELWRRFHLLNLELHLIYCTSFLSFFLHPCPLCVGSLICLNQLWSSLQFHIHELDSKNIYASFYVCLPSFSFLSCTGLKWSVPI